MRSACRTVIFKIEGIDETGLDEDVKKELFEELLTEAESATTMKDRRKFTPSTTCSASTSTCTRQARLFGITKTEESLGSQCAGMKNLQLKDKRSLDIMLGKNSGSKVPRIRPCSRARALPGRKSF